MVDDLIREITEPDGEPAAVAAKSAARDRLLAAAHADPEPPPRKRRRLGGRGLAAVIALLAVPTGVAVATELSGDGEQTFVNAEDCPELFAAMQESTFGETELVLADCPVGDEVDQMLGLLGALEERRAQVESQGGPATVKGIVGFGRSADGEPWTLDGIAGAADADPGP